MQPLSPKTDDLIDTELGKGIPYGVYDQTRFDVWVSSGHDHDTAYGGGIYKTLVAGHGLRVYSNATELLITAAS